MGSSFQRLTGVVWWASRLTLVFGAISLLWSLFGLLSPTPPIHFHEYPLRGLATEIGGHIVFGLAAAIPTFDVGLILLSGGESILIDTDHITGALDLPIRARLAHSVGFMVLAPLALGRLSRKKEEGLNGPVALVTLGAILAHIGYDIFAGNGSIPILTPVDLSYFVFPFWAWIPFEAAAALVCAWAGVVLRRKRASGGAG